MNILDCDLGGKSGGGGGLEPIDPGRIMFHGKLYEIHAQVRSECLERLE